MRIKLLYIILILLVILGLRVYHQIYSDYHPMDEEAYEEISTIVNWDSGIVCLLIPQKTYYRIGEKPQLDVLIINKTDSTVYLPGCLDGSDLGLRYPVANIEMLNRKPRRRFICPMVNPLTSHQIQKLKPGESFNPIHSYMLEVKTYKADSIFNMKDTQHTSLDYFWPPATLDARNYLLPGKYQLQFTYSTKKDTNVVFGWNINPDFNDIDPEICEKIPEVELKSNVVTLRYWIF